MKINVILLVLKWLFNQTKLQLFLHYFWLFLIAQTTVQPIQGIIIYLIYYLSSIVLWSFSYHFCVIYCWIIIFELIRSAFIDTETCPGCVSKLSVGRIQTGHTDLLHLQVCGRLWRGWRLGVQTCLLQLIALLDLKYPSSYLLEPYFVDCWLVCIIFIVSLFIDTETPPRVW